MKRFVAILGLALLAASGGCFLCGRESCRAKAPCAPDPCCNTAPAIYGAPGPYTGVAPIAQTQPLAPVGQ